MQHPLPRTSLGGRNDCNDSVESQMAIRTSQLDFIVEGMTTKEIPTGLIAV